MPSKPTGGCIHEAIGRDFETVGPEKTIRWLDRWTCNDCGARFVPAPSPKADAAVDETPKEVS